MMVDLMVDWMMDVGKLDDVDSIVDLIWWT